MRAMIRSQAQRLVAALLFVVCVVLPACLGGGPKPEPADSADHTHAEDHDSGDDHAGGDGADAGHDAGTDGSHGAGEAVMQVRVRLDGAPIGGALLTQPGVERTWRTDAAGEATVSLDLGVVGAVALLVSHPEARIGGDELYASTLASGLFEVDLQRFDRRDNLLYIYQDPGSPERFDTTSYCSHCHAKLTEDWFASPHRRAASNPLVHDLYAGTAAAYDSEASCAAAGGRWRLGIGPGTGASAGRCYIGDGLLPAYNADCGVDTPCDGRAERTGGCADCHAPAIDGRRGGRDLLEATGIAYENGVHCDLCHKVESVELEAEGPGVAGKLNILRPSEPSSSPALGDWAPLTFGPYADVRNPRMGSVARDHFGGSELCAACHEHVVDEFATGAAPDRARWPDGKLPVMTTYSELLEGPLGPDSVEGRPGVVCQDCHMPPDPTQGNSADLHSDEVAEGHAEVVGEPGIATGWLRPPGAVRRHAWFGPRSEEQALLPLAASLDLRTAWVEGDDGPALEAVVTTHNVGPAHALPTGEPMRQVVLLVEARCGEERLVQVGGDVVPDVGGSLEARPASADWTRWPGAQVGEVIRVIDVLNEPLDYVGPLRFGDGSLSPEAKGMWAERLLAEVEILSVGPDGLLGLSAPLPAGDRAVRAQPLRALPEDGAPVGAYAGAPGMVFSKVMVAPDGRRGVPYFVANDVASDNRIPAGGSATTTHRFAAPCAEPTVEAVLQYRRAPFALVAERGWPVVEQRMTAVRR
jgi:hypothetical protein